MPEMSSQLRLGNRSKAWLSWATEGLAVGTAARFKAQILPIVRGLCLNVGSRA